MSRSGTLGRLFGQAEPCIELHPQDLLRHKLLSGDLVRIRSRRGELVLPVAASESVRPAQAFVAMHWGDEYVGGQARDGAALAGVNALTTSAHCPVSKQPELKHAAVRIESAGLPWRLVAAAWLPAGEALHLRERLRALMPSFGYASALPFGREPDGSVGVVFRAGHVEPVHATLLQAVESALGLSGARVLRYADPRRGQHRAIRLEDSVGDADDARLQAFVLAGDVRAEAWVLPLWRDEQPARAFGARLLAANATPPAALVSRGAQVCSCFDIGEAQIVEALARIGGSAEMRLARVQEELRCGTNCGSCKPALRVLAGRSLEAA